MSLKGKFVIALSEIRTAENFIRSHQFLVDRTYVCVSVSESDERGAIPLDSVTTLEQILSKTIDTLLCLLKWRTKHDVRLPVYLCFDIIFM